MTWLIYAIAGLVAWIAAGVLSLALCRMAAINDPERDQ